MIVIRRALGLRWLGWYRARQVRKQLVALKLKRENPRYYDYDYASTLMCCTDEGREIIRIIGSDAMNELNKSFNKDITFGINNLSKIGRINYPVAARYNHFFSDGYPRGWWSAAEVRKREYHMGEIRKQLLNHWCKTLLGEEL